MHNYSHSTAFGNVKPYPSNTSRLVLLRSLGLQLICSIEDRESVNQMAGPKESLRRCVSGCNH